MPPPVFIGWQKVPVQIRSKKKSSTDLFHELTNLVQTSKDGTSKFILVVAKRYSLLMRNLIRVLSIQKIEFKQPFWMNKIGPHLADPELSDEDLMDYVNQAVTTAQEARETKFKMARHKSGKVNALNPIQYGLFLKHYGMGGGALWPPL